jgi:hypothetical protein
MKLRIFSPGLPWLAAVVAIVSSGTLIGCESSSNQLGSFGTPIETGGHGAALPVSDDFGLDEARELQSRISSAEFHQALEKYNCGDPVPEFRFDVTLYEAAELSSRRVQIDYVPALDLAGRQRCLHFGMAYLLGKAVAEIDPTKTFSKTYRKPSGETFEAKTDRTTREPRCDCGQQNGGAEWVTFPGPEEDESALFLGPFKK